MANGIENQSQYGRDFPHLERVRSMNCPQTNPSTESIIAVNANNPVTAAAATPNVSVQKTKKYVPTIWKIVLQPKSDIA